MKTNKLIFTFIMISGAAYSQVVGGASDAFIRDFANNWGNNVAKSVSIDVLKRETKGSPYFDENFYDAKFNGGVAVPQKLRYDAYTDQMEFLQEGKTYEVNKFIGLQIEFPKINKNYIVVKYLSDGKESEGYMVVNYWGKKYSLLTQEKIDLRETQGMNNGLVNNSGSSFVKRKDVFYIANEKGVFPVKSAGDLKNIVEGNLKAIEYLGANKINVKKIDELTDFVKYIN
ncbi:hypothetical protein OZ664_08750 [Elizabethkingia sp. HX WHF]|uniref:hypothetical protein n=1 Tax=Elizabethkingia TaxID=308865 RepID=UPI00099A8D29|nr:MULTISPECIES: hypothetical protein [Elizabethkingia]ATL45641.1 hypothetical protein CQS02_17635 [Elizabethkingia miricola]MCL1636760.1 hypothetical protein [Elizabethkingia bruuniana]MDX8564087.1 hypothetical protein [Elizabethkingia sp. HX WHF]OPC18997.1 hypothetical protein BAY00_13635 [Elizabethkingia bruuniana]OPC57090.1 hypothetical protein BAY07_07240 [Elizabethkingia bruuniana]